MLLPWDMDAYKRFSQNELFLSLKRDLAMITQQVFVAEKWYRNARKLTDTEALFCAEIEKMLEAIKQEQYELTEKLKDAQLGHLSAEAGLKNAEKQAEDQRQKLHVIEINLATEKQVVLNLKAAL
ncbi:uncharacterized protein LOC115983716 [Quercus lobata]|uniref:uncharacterized protein LOC115983716 n=1 Tax=Quercus lobata TaxID=97700 RepID=UPI00124742DD|nr:uncharacterized protein LOC115983716 [Quercus lobata]